MNAQQYAKQTRQYFDNLAPIWDSICQHDKNKLQLLIDLAAPAPDSRMLDIGCGAGVMIEQLLSANPRELLSLDISPLMIEQAKRKYCDPRLRLISKDFFDLEEEGFDLAILYSVYPHFPLKKQLVRHTAHCLVNGGRFMVAHSENRQIINTRHQNGMVAQLSLPLKEAKEEAKIWQTCFEIDILIDTPQLYVISGWRI